ncbi:NVEALA domain-containing protein [Bacteroides rodentium]|uniref:NVEALA domain-containing protein n=1 Tax=Bacteroides rodentium TaxID=691816 RepID=UPI000470A7DA|nr:NVEALA domain-containing protein [Bacteroides rodentium]
MKKMIKIAFVAAFVAIAGYGVYTNQKAETMSDLMLANVEALAWPEGSSLIGFFRVLPLPVMNVKRVMIPIEMNVII